MPTWITAALTFLSNITGWGAAVQNSKNTPEMLSQKEATAAMSEDAAITKQENDAIASGKSGDLGEGL
jgi:hypothetical protein